MQLEHRFEVPVGIDKAWTTLLDMEQVGPCFPGAILDHVDGDECPVQSVLDAACERDAAARDRDDEDHPVGEPVAARPLRRGCVVLLRSEEQAETIHRRPA